VLGADEAADRAPGVLPPTLAAPPRPPAILGAGEDETSCRLSGDDTSFFYFKFARGEKRAKKKGLDFP